MARKKAPEVPIVESSESSEDSSDGSSSDEYVPEVKKLPEPKRVVRAKRQPKTSNGDENKPTLKSRSKSSASSTITNGHSVKTENVPQKTITSSNANIGPRKPFNVVTSLLNLSWKTSISGRSLSLVDDFRQNHVTQILLPSLKSIPISLNKVDSPRVMSMVWHPTDPNALIVGAKHGDMYYLSDFEQAIPQEHKLPTAKNEQFLDGIGPAGGVTTIKFNLNQPHQIFTTSIAGTVSRLDLNTADNMCIFQVDPSPNRDCLDHWFTALDYDEQRKRLLVGDNKGNFFFMPEDIKGNKKSKYDYHRLHKSKITTIDHHPRDGNLITTTSTDRTVKVWDVRNLSECKPIKTIEFEGPIEAGFFSKTNGGTFVTSDQRQEIRKFCTSNWKQEFSIKHSQDTFQHLTPIKGCWHPSADIFGIPRYNSKDKSDSHGVDFFNMKTGQLIYTLEDEVYNGIKSVSTWNCVGDTLAVSQFSNIIVYKKEEFLENIFEKKLSIDKALDRGQPSKSKSRDEMFKDWLGGGAGSGGGANGDKRKKGKEKNGKTATKVTAKTVPKKKK